MPTKRPLSDVDDAAANPSTPTATAKRRRVGGAAHVSHVSRASDASGASERPAVLPRTGADLLSPLSDELLIRILSFLPLPNLLAVSPVSRRFSRLSEDSQLWKALYYARFVLPRAMRIPGFRESMGLRGRDHKLHYSAKRLLWADGRLGGVVRDGDKRVYDGRIRGEEPGSDRKHERVNWKRQYKLRHNWSRGKCAVEELKLGSDPDQADHEDVEGLNMLVKVVEGLAITADRLSGLRAWDLKTRELLAQISLHEANHEVEVAPSCMAIDDRGMDDKSVDIAVGFVDGSFGVWRLGIKDKRLGRRYRHGKSSNGELVGMAYSHPYLLTATESVLISLYTFEIPEHKITDGDDVEQEFESETERGFDSETLKAESETDEEAHDRAPEEPSRQDDSSKASGNTLTAPFLMTSLKSHTSDPPLALSIRRMATSTIASIAYTFFTREGWSIGIQDLQITPNEAGIKAVPTITTRLAYSTPVTSGWPHSAAAPPSPGPRMPPSQNSPSSTPPSSSSPHPARIASTAPADRVRNRDRGPTTLCYSHPYLLATLPDNTLVLHLCTSGASSLRISPGIRLWGHTSGISDAEITARGKAVSVSSRGEEMRVWELEGRPSGVRSRSVEVRAGAGASPSSSSSSPVPPPPLWDVQSTRLGLPGWEDRRNWVGFDEEMVIVLKESNGGRESLMVYDFT